MKRTYEKERVAALSAGLAIVVLAWIGSGGFCIGLDRVSRRSLDMALWTDLGGGVGSPKPISYVLIIRAQRRNPALCPEHEEATREASTAATGELTKVPKCIEDVDALEKDKLARLDGRLRDHDCGVARALIVCAARIGWMA